MKNAKTISLMEYELPVSIKAEETGGFVAQCDKWKDCFAQGESIEEVLSEITHVATSLIELYKEEGLKIPLKTKTPEKKFNGLTITFPLIVSTR